MVFIFYILLYLNEGLIIYVYLFSPKLKCRGRCSGYRIYFHNSGLISSKNFSSLLEGFNKNLNSNTLDYISYYLAGLLEGDGHFNTPKKLHTPSGSARVAGLETIFALKDKPSAELLKSLFGGRVYGHPNKKIVRWLVQDKNSVINIINLINGKLRTPKINSFYDMVDFLNTKRANITKLPLDTSPLNNNAWLSGFILPLYKSFLINFFNGVDKPYYKYSLFNSLVYYEGEASRFFRIRIHSQRNTHLMFYVGSSPIRIFSTQAASLSPDHRPSKGASSGANNRSDLSLVVWGKNLPSTVGIKFTLNQLRMVQLAPYPYSVIIGLVLSDGWILSSSKNSKNARLGFKQSLYRADYVWFVFNILSHYCSSYPKEITGIRAGKRFFGLQIFTRSMPCITKLHSLFYPNGVKIVPHNIYELLTPAAIAHLIMGDGSSTTCGGIRIGTDSFSIKDCIKLTNVLIIKYNINCTIQIQKKGTPRMYIGTKSKKKLIPLIIPYMIPSMYYKLGIIVSASSL